MRGIKSIFGFKKIQKKYFFMVAILGLLIVVTIGTYAYFVVSVGGVTASELLVAELSYGVTITDDDGNPVSGNSVGVSAGDKQFYNIMVTSVNKIDSKFTLAYKPTGGNPTVKYTDKTQWSSNEVIKGYDNTNTYSKKIRVVVDNTSGTSAVTVTFGVYGGYTFNTYNAIALKDGFFTVGGPYGEVVAVKSSKLVDLIETDTECVTASSNKCMYSGGSINNYLQYPEADNVTDNMWRIMGTYKLGDQVLAKIVSETTGQTSVANVSSGLSDFYKTLDNPGQTIYKTNMFNCSASGCTSSSYENIGLISTYEYESLGGVNSYLTPSNSYFGLNGSSVSNITSGGIVGTDSSTTSGLRPSVYLQTDIKVTGSGTATDPYRISPNGDINLMAYTVNGAEPTSTQTWNWALQNKVVDKITCSKGTTATWNYNNNTVTLSNVQVPDYCTIDFKDGYLVKTKFSSTGMGTVTPASVGVGHGGSVEFTVSAGAGYVMTGASVSCTNGTVGAINTTTGKFTVSNVTAASTCTVTLKPDKKTLVATLSDGSKYTVGTISSFSSVTGGSTITQGYNITGKIYKTGSDYYFRGNPSDNWVKFAGKYWRIIRSNSSEGTRLLYAGTSPEGQDGYINNTTYKWYDSNNNADYVQWSYASSTIGNALTSWYNSNITGTNANMVNTSVAYCNDTSVARTSGSNIYYGAYGRLKTNRTPSYSCGTNSNTTHRKIGLMTADEVAYAGGVYIIKAPNTYYYRNSKSSGCTGKSGDPCSVTGDNSWWTMSPHSFFSGWADMFHVYGAGSPGYLSNSYVNASSVVRPVVTLKSSVLVSGSGTASDPYVPSL